MSSANKYLFQAALEIQRFFTENNWDFALIGGLAVLRWGQPRTTVDVDGTLLTGFADEEKCVEIRVDVWRFVVWGVELNVSRIALRRAMEPMI
jgi:hypothetical protein